MNSAESRLVFLSHEGRPDGIEISMDQLSPGAVARAFSLDPSTVWLREEAPGHRAFFPTPDLSRFHLNSDVTRAVVEGCPLPDIERNSVGRVMSLSTAPGPSSAINTSGARVIGRPVSTVSRRVQTVNVKVVKATMKTAIGGKAEFTPQTQTFVDVTESTANVIYITTAVQRKWGPQYILVTSDGLQIEDGSGTQGLKFWKCGSRRIYAVREVETKRAITIPSDSSDDESDIIPLVKRRREGIDGIARDIKALKSDVASLFEVSRRTRVPMGLKKMLIDTFRCTICQSTPMTPPIIFSKCCKSIIGCQECVDKWYCGNEGLGRSCPRCRAERGFTETCRVNGLSEFLEMTEKILNDVGDDSDTN